MILGIDEVGRGPWAGPLVVGAVVLGDGSFDGLNDSKKLTKKRREHLAPEIIERALATGLGWVSAQELDSLGLSASLRLATIRAVEQVDLSGIAYDEIIIDGTVNFLSETRKGQYVQTLPKADGLIPEVSAASIIAKVARDAYMLEQDVSFPEYGFGRHAGYGTAFHRAALDAHGATPLHRMSFAPLKKYSSPSVPEGPRRAIASLSKTPTQIGSKAESAVAEFLEAKGHTILLRNWKTPRCEIDIISKSGETIYFTEVKYRSGVHQGGGIAAVTEKKLKQMHFAAEVFMAQHEMAAVADQLQLAVASVTGDQFQSIDWFSLT